MSELDRLKEQLVYLRLWLGIVVVAEISLMGWLASAFETAPLRLGRACHRYSRLVRLGHLSTPSPDPTPYKIGKL